MTRALVLVVAAVLLLSGCLSEEPEAEPGPSASGPTRTVFLGDSITAGWVYPGGPRAERRSWVTYAVRDDRSPWLQTANVAIAGETLAQMAARYDRDVVPERPTQLVVMGGTNDVAAGAAISDSRLVLRDLLQRALDDGLEVWLVAPPPIASAYGRDIGPMVRMQSDLADELGVRFIDARGAVSTPDGDWREGFSSDGVHPTARGAKAFGEEIVAAATSQVDH